MYAERLLAGVTPENSARFARPGGTVVRSNHPTFVLGHLCLYPVRVMQYLGLPTEPAAFPPEYELFKFGAECLEDPQGAIYPPYEELRQRYFESYAAAIATVEGAPDHLFDAPNPAEGRLRDLFPTVGSALNFYLVGHPQVHLGQISTWRRAMGLPPA
jgi:hypothetical protein